ncbi:hypothetical protein C8Q76DRAFT_855023 [Earliella scabrosa]|nr:hypothetical protein C8Q76DRAFT_855023 [Earliella scabrosa]
MSQDAKRNHVLSPLFRSRAPQLFLSFHLSLLSSDLPFICALMIAVALCWRTLPFFHSLFWYNAGDPWREATKAASETRFSSMRDQPLAVSDGFYCSDLSTTNANADALVKAVQQQALKSIADWLAEWKPSAHAH